jgi:Asp/Glu/hydantoin racemase
MSGDARLEQALAEITRAAIEIDGAEAVLIGGGPLGRVAAGLARRVTIPVIEPVAAGVARLAERLGLTSNHGTTAADGGDGPLPEPADHGG